MINTLKNYTKEKVLSYLLALAINSSDETLVRMTHLMEMIPKKDYYKERIRWIRGLVRDKHPSIEFPAGFCVICTPISATNGSATCWSITC